MEKKEIIQLIPPLVTALLTAAPAVIAIWQNKKKKKAGSVAKNQGRRGTKKALCDVLKIGGGVMLGVFIFGLIRSDGSLPIVSSLVGNLGVALVSIGYLVELAEKLEPPIGRRKTTA
jgi:hypothetical protein